MKPFFRTSRLLLPAVAAAVALAAPASASASGWSCQAGALNLGVLGSTLNPVTVGTLDQTCQTASATLTKALPAPLDVGVAVASTKAEAQGVLAAGGIADLRVKSLPDLPIKLPDIPVPSSLSSVTVPLPTVPLLPLPSSINVDLTQAVNALLPNRQLPNTDLLRIQGAMAYASASCSAGVPKLAGSSQVLGISVLGQDLGVNQVVDQAVSLLDSGNIDLSNIDPSLASIPSVGGVADSVLRPIVENALKPVLATLPPISIPAVLANVKVTPGEQTMSNGVLTQRALHATVSILGQSIADLTLGQASVGANSVDCGQPELACGTRPVTLIDVLPSGDRVKLYGVADKKYAGQTVNLMFDATGDQVAQAVVGQDGSFTTTAPMPKADLRNSDIARYRAVIGKEQSQSLKLARRLQVTEMKAHGGKVTIAGKVVGPMSKSGSPITVKRRLSCSKYVKVGTVKPNRDGSFSYTFKAPTGTTEAVYRLSTTVLKRAGSDKEFPTYTLPRGVNLQ